MAYTRNRTQALYPSGLTLDEVRSRLSGLHFAKEALSDGERELLWLAESLLTFIDDKGEEIL